MTPQRSQAGAAFQATFDAAAALLRDPLAGQFGLTACHGLQGAVELFLAAYSVLGEMEHMITAQWIVERAISRYGTEVEQWPDGVAGNGACPGLMTGAAGALMFSSDARLPRPSRASGSSHCQPAREHGSSGAAGVGARSTLVVVERRPAG
jgi:lanthionine synthetase-like protein